MAIDRKYIFDKVVFFLKKETKFFTSSELHSTIGVDAFRQIGRKLEYPKSNYSSFIASGVWNIQMPSDFVKVDNTKEIVFKDSTQIRKLIPKRLSRDDVLSVVPGVPENYFMEDQKTMGIYPPSTSGVVVIPYVKFPTSLSSDSGTNELTENCYMAATYYTVAECMLKDNDERYSVYIKMYDNEMKDLEETYNVMYEETQDIAPKKR